MRERQPGDQDRIVLDGIVEIHIELRARVICAWHQRFEAGVLLGRPVAALGEEPHMAVGLCPALEVPFQLLVQTGTPGAD